LVAFKQSDLAGLTLRRLQSLKVLVIYGADPALVLDTSRIIVVKLSPAKGPAPETIRIAGSVLAKDKSVLANEVFALSLLGDQVIVEVADAGEDVLSLLQDVIANEVRGNFVVVLAGSLSKSSKLRKFAEEGEFIGCLALYEENLGQVMARIGQVLEAQNVQFGAGAHERFFGLVGSDYRAAAAELEKLLVYCLGQSTILLEDVEMICGDTSELGIDHTIDAMMSGDMVQADRSFAQLDGAAAGGFLPQLTAHLNKLISLRMDMAKGSNADMAFRNAKPPLFFGRRDAFISQLRIWDLEGLLLVSQQVHSCTEACRTMNALEFTLLSRCVLSIARMARGLKSKAA
jgi:DNA polymerase III subunit delta